MVPPILNRAKPTTKTKKPLVTEGSQSTFSTSKGGEPPIALFELAAIAFTFGLGSPEYKAAAERRAAEQGTKRFWK